LLLALGDADCLLTVAEMARRLRMSKATVYKLVAEGKLPHVRVGNAIRFLESPRSPTVKAGPLSSRRGRRS
jgi:excisionase family DNA binding protein